MEHQLEQLNKAVTLAEASALGLLKSHVKEYTRADGTVVQEHDDSRIKREDDAKNNLTCTTINPKVITTGRKRLHKETQVIKRQEKIISKNFQNTKKQ